MLVTVTCAFFFFFRGESLLYLKLPLAMERRLLAGPPPEPNMPSSSLSSLVKFYWPRGGSREWPQTISKHERK